MEWKLGQMTHQKSPEHMVMTGAMPRVRPEEKRGHPLAHLQRVLGGPAFYWSLWCFFIPKLSKHHLQTVQESQLRSGS